MDDVGPVFGVFENAGPEALVCVAIAVLVVAGAAVVALRRGPRVLAFVLLGAALLPIPIGAAGAVANQARAYRSVVALGPAVTPLDIRSGVRRSAAAMLVAGFSVVLGVAAATAAVWQCAPRRP